MSSFCDYIRDHYMVFLTEREWAAPTLSKLAGHIINKQSNPEKMLRQVEREQKKWKKGVLVAFLFFTFIIIGSFFVCAGSLERRLVVTFGIGIFIYSCLGFISYREKIKFQRETKWLRKL